MHLYEEIEKGEAASVKGKTREKLVENKELALLSRTLGTINLAVPIEESIEDLKTKPWNEEKILEKFKELNFNRYIERFHLNKKQETIPEKTELLPKL